MEFKSGKRKNYQPNIEIIYSNIYNESVTFLGPYKK
jgi:hypothetical protein